MKIYEITDKNKLWSEMNDIDINVIRNTYNFLAKSLSLLIRLNSPSRSKIILSNVESFISTIDKILNINYPDKNDEDIVTLNRELVKMKTDIINLSAQLKL